MHFRSLALVFLASSVFAGAAACKRGPRDIAYELRDLPKTIAELTQRLGKDVELETTLVQGKLRLRRVTHLVAPGARRSIALEGTAAERHGFRPVLIAGPVIPRAAATKELATALFEIATVIESQPQHLLATCMALHAKCAVAEPRVDVPRALTWRCATVESWASDPSGTRFAKLFGIATICNGKNDSGAGRSYAAVAATMMPGVTLPVVALPGYALVRHRGLERTLADETLLGPRGAPARAAALFRLDPQPAAGVRFHPLVSVAFANVMLCGRDGTATAPCVTSPEFLPKALTLSTR